MNLFQAFLYGAIQGFTEFLPVSSSAHLVIIPFLLHWKIPPENIFTLNVIVQLASLVAVILYFRKEISQLLISFFTGLIRKKPFNEPMSRLAWLIILASIPAGIIGLSFKDAIEESFNQPKLVAFLLLGTATLLVLGEKIGKKIHNLDHMTWVSALWIGFFQALALLPGVSRSGATISAGLIRHLRREEAARFSFIMYIPVMFVAGLMAIIDLIQCQCLGTAWTYYLAATIASGVVSYFSIKWLLTFLTTRSLYIFAFYCALISMFTLLFPFS